MPKITIEVGDDRTVKHMQDLLINAKIGYGDLVSLDYFMEKIVILSFLKYWEIDGEQCYKNGNDDYYVKLAKVRKKITPELFDKVIKGDHAYPSDDTKKINAIANKIFKLRGGMWV